MSASNSAHHVQQSDLVARTELQVSTEIDGETVLLQFGSGKYFSLNSVGNFVWSLLESPRSVGAICEALTSEYDVELHQCLPDVVALLTDLKNADLVSLTVASSPPNTNLRQE